MISFFIYRLDIILGL